METTLCIIKPDGVERKQVGRIIDILERKFTFESMEMKKLSPDEVQGFYAEHRGKAFFDDLVRYMSSGKVVLMTLGGENAVARLRELLGTTDPQSAAPGTLRREFGVNLQQNTIHGLIPSPLQKEKLLISLGDPQKKESVESLLFTGS